MKTGIIIALMLLMAAPAQAEPSKEELTNGLLSLAVCVQADSVAMAKLASIVRQLKTAEPKDMAEDNAKIVRSAISDINTLSEIGNVETIIAHGIADTLIVKHGDTVDSLNEKIDPINMATTEKMNDLLKDADYKGVTEIMTNALSICTETTEKVVKLLSPE